MTKKQEWFLEYLKNVFLKTPEQWTSPTEIGKEYGRQVLNKEGLHSSSASPTCKKLVEMGLIVRNKNGWYKFKQ